MKSTGIVRKVDQLGRVVIPKELRKILNIKEDESSLEIYTEGDEIILRKYEPSCIFCGESKGVVTYKGKNICSKCMKELRREIAHVDFNSK